jgi:hypothetical protein
MPNHHDQREKAFPLLDLRRVLQNINDHSLVQRVTMQSIHRQNPSISREARQYSAPNQQAERLNGGITLRCLSSDPGTSERVSALPLNLHHSSDWNGAVDDACNWKPAAPWLEIPAATPLDRAARPPTVIHRAPVVGPQSLSGAKMATAFSDT